MVGGLATYCDPPGLLWDGGGAETEGYEAHMTHELLVGGDSVGEGASAGVGASPALGAAGGGRLVTFNQEDLPGGGLGGTRRRKSSSVVSGTDSALYGGQSPVKRTPPTRENRRGAFDVQGVLNPEP